MSDPDQPQTETPADAAAPSPATDAAAPVAINPDGSITLAESGQSSAAPAKPPRQVGKVLKADPRHKSMLAGKFINCLMESGKKSIATVIFYDCLDHIAEKLKSDPLKVFVTAIDNAKPIVEVKSKRVGGANYQVPVEVRSHRAQTLAIRWILEAVRSRRGRPTSEKLAQELIDCYNKTGTTIQKREAVHRMAEANKAFAHFA